jgi:hypothetical protein
VLSDVVAAAVQHSQKSDLDNGVVFIVAMDAEAVTNNKDHAREGKHKASSHFRGAAGSRDVSKPDRASLAQALMLPMLHAGSEKDRELLIIDERDEGTRPLFRLCTQTQRSRATATFQMIIFHQEMP